MPSKEKAAGWVAQVIIVKMTLLTDKSIYWLSPYTTNKHLLPGWSRCWETWGWRKIKEVFGLLLSFCNKQELSNSTRIIQKDFHISIDCLIKKLFVQVHKQFEYLIIIHTHQIYTRVCNLICFELTLCRILFINISRMRAYVHVLTSIFELIILHFFRI